MFGHFCTVSVHFKLKVLSVIRFDYYVYIFSKVGCLFEK